MPTIHRGATLTPRFREFLPGWVADQPWYAGPAIPDLTPVGCFRFEDPAGEVGIETHLLRDGPTVYQVPLTYRGAPLDGGPLVATAEHSVLGTRWIYDAVADPVWVDELSRLVATNGTSEPGAKTGVGPAEARGVRVRSAGLMADGTTIDLNRVLSAGHPAYDPGVVGMVMGSWHPDGADGPVATGCLAVLRGESR